MTLLYVLLALLCAVFISLLMFYSVKRRKQYFSRPLLTPSEQRMYQRLKQAVPEYNVLCQVAFSALITNQNFKIRNKFNRKVTDFVLMNSDCKIVAIIELDDPTHLNKAEDDRLRDHMLTEAGYRVIRFNKIPSVNEIHSHLFS